MLGVILLRVIRPSVSVVNVVAPLRNVFLPRTQKGLKMNSQHQDIQKKTSITDLIAELSITDLIAELSLTDLIVTFSTMTFSIMILILMDLICYIHHNRLDWNTQHN